MRCKVCGLEMEELAYRALHAEARFYIIQRAIAKTATGGDGSEDDDKPYTLDEILSWIDREQDYRVQGQVKAHAQLRKAQARIEALEAALSAQPPAITPCRTCGSTDPSASTACSNTWHLPEYPHDPR